MTMPRATVEIQRLSGLKNPSQVLWFRTESTRNENRELNQKGGIQKIDLNAKLWRLFGCLRPEQGDGKETFGYLSLEGRSDFDRVHEFPVSGLRQRKGFFL